MKRTAVFLLMLLLAACSDAKPTPPTQATSEMIESPLQNTVISSFDTYPPKPAVGAEGKSISSLPSPSECAGETPTRSVQATPGSASGPDSFNTIP
jgi:hypothetical protein